MRAFAHFVATLPLLVALAACTSILNVQEINAGDGGVLTGEDGGPVDRPADCVRDTDCTSLLPETVSGTRCAEAKCAANHCRFVALDQDGDGFSVACISKDSSKPIVQSATLDCDDAASGTVPGSEVDCTDGSFTLPGRGECRPGKKRCKPDGAFDVCVGVVGKKAKDTCTGKDDDCDGTVDRGCPCTTGATQACGTSAVGICKMGTQTCIGSVLQACAGAVFPAAKACASASDNDCNGSADNQEAACKCDGMAAGATKPCLTGLAGICSPGAQTCVASGSSAAWGRCIANTGPAARDCGGATDNDCNGLADNAETPCKCGIYFVGQSKRCPGSTNPGMMFCESFGSTAGWNTDECAL
jgi:hypothetical protein